ncbi:MAG TPA: adenylate/guanylate cyclase domain-containing protein [Acidimicrobiales bacterium]
MIASTARLRTLLLALVVLAAAAVATVTWATRAFGTLEGNTIDTRFSIRGTQSPRANIVLVKIDDATFQDLGLQWPFPRRIHAQLINRIAAEHPAAIVYDVQFTEASQHGQADDLDLLNAINDAHGRTVFATTETDAHGNTRFVGTAQGTKLLHEVHSQVGNGLFPYDTGGVIRRMSYAVDNLKTLSVAAAEVATGHHVPSSEFAHHHNWIDFTGPSGTIPAVSFSTALRGHLPAHFFHGKIVVVGATAPSLQDVHPTTIDSQMPGAEIQANAIDTVLRGMPLAAVPGWVAIVLIVLMALAVPVISGYVGMIYAGLAAFGLALALALGVQLAFNAGWVVPFTYPLLALVLATAGALGVQLVTVAFERLWVRDLFARFVPENVVDEVLASAGGPRLGGVERAATVMFIDLRGFTSLAETLTPTRVIDILNHYLSEMSDAILDNGGTLVAYLGDGIMAVFGAPLVQEDHADRALRTAREMLDVRLPRFNEWLRQEGLSDGVRMGIGLNTGHVMSGNVGSERRIEYTVVGDTTNTASRIEGLTKGTPHQLLLAGSTKESLVDPPPDLIHVGETDIRGRVSKLQLWSIGLASEDDSATPADTSTPETAGQSVKAN